MSEQYRISMVPVVYGPEGIVRMCDSVQEAVNLGKVLNGFSDREPDGDSHLDKLPTDGCLERIRDHQHA